MLDLLLPGTHSGSVSIIIAVNKQTRASMKDWCFKSKQIAGENSLPLNINVIIVAILATIPKQVITIWLFSNISFHKGLSEFESWIVWFVDVFCLSFKPAMKETTNIVNFLRNIQISFLKGNWSVSFLKSQRDWRKEAFQIPWRKENVYS